MSDDQPVVSASVTLPGITVKVVVLSVILFTIPVLRLRWAAARI